jgi:hypothetical protein
VHWLLIVGLCLMLAGLLLSLRQSVLTVRDVARHQARLATALRRRGAGQDWSQGVLWLGMFLVLASQTAQQLRRNAPAEDLILSLTASAAAIFLCGLSVGRLSMRFQQRSAAAVGRDHDDE